jgi:hypothetical protein
MPTKATFSRFKNPVNSKQSVAVWTAVLPVQATRQCQDSQHHAVVSTAILLPSFVRGRFAGAPGLIVGLLQADSVLLAIKNGVAFASVGVRIPFAVSPSSASFLRFQQNAVRLAGAW